MKTLVPSVVVMALSVALPTPSFSQTSQPWLALVAYAAPVKGDTVLGGEFSAATEDEVVSLAVEGCKLNTREDQWANCVPGRWINTGRALLVATLCDTIDQRNDHHQVLQFLKDGVTATDEQIRDAVRHAIPDREILEGGCQKLRIDRTEPDALQTARSVAIDRPRKH